MSISKERTVVLLGTGFDASLAVSSIKQLREAGNAVLIVGQTAGFVRDINGIAVHPEKSLSDIAHGEASRLLLLPGGTAYLSTLLTDPRVHNLIDAIVNNNGFIVVSEKAKHLLVEMEGKQSLTKACFMFQKIEEFNAITPGLINLLI